MDVHLNSLCILLFKTPVAAFIVFQQKKLSMCLLLKSAAHFPCENKPYKYIQKRHVKRFCFCQSLIIMPLSLNHTRINNK